MSLEAALTADDPGATYPGYDSEEPTIENEKLAWWLRKQFYNMQQAGFLWQQTDENESITRIGTLLGSWNTAVATWFSDCKTAVLAGTDIPEPPSLFLAFDPAPMDSSTYAVIFTLKVFIRSFLTQMYEMFTGKWGNAGYIGKGAHDSTVADLYEADVMAVQAWLDAAIQAKIDGLPIPAKPTLSTPDDYKGMLSGNQLILNTQNNIRLRVNVSLLDGELRGAVGMDSGDLDDLVDKLDEAMMIDGVPILEALAAVGLHITLADGTAHIEYGDEP